MFNLTRPVLSKSFKVLGIQQIAIGSLSLSSLESLWVDTLGLKKVSRYRSSEENVDEIICAVGEGDAKVEIDLMTPLDPKISPRVHVPPLNHVGLWVSSLEGAVESLESKGYKIAPGGIRKGATGHDVAFIHPKPKEGKGTEGVLIELVQAERERGGVV